MRATDFRVEYYGTLSFIVPTSPSALAWVERKIGKDNGYQPKWPTVIVEDMYLQDIVEGMRNDGLVMESS